MIGREIIIATFAPTPAIPPGFEGRRIAKLLKDALRKRIEGYELKCIDIRTAAPAPGPDGTKTSARDSDR